MTERGVGAAERPDWARRAAARAERRGGYMAGILADYRELEQRDDGQVAQELGCPLERLPLLGLCREPRREAPGFGADVREIAEFAGAQVLPLARLIRAVDSARALAGAVPGALAAARDAGPERDAEADDEAEPGKPGGDGSLA